MDTYTMLTHIRGQLLEMDSQPITDRQILQNMNLAYTMIYSHMIRSQDTRFGVKVTFPILANQTEYELPKEAFGQRIEQLVVPFPPTNNQNALGFHDIKRVDFKETYKHNVPRIRTWVPEVYSILDNTLYIYPKPITNMDAYLVISPQLVPLGLADGQILSFTANSITVDGLNTTELADRLAAQPLNAFLSVCDYWSGDVKRLYTYNNVTGNTITLANIARTSYMGQAVTPITASLLDDVQQDDYIVAGYATGISMFSTEYDEFIINMTVLKIRSSLNENDPEILNAIKENMKQLQGDTAGRPTGLHIQRTFGRGASYTRPGRIQ